MNITLGIKHYHKYDPEQKYFIMDFVVPPFNLQNSYNSCFNIFFGVFLLEKG